MNITSTEVNEVEVIPVLVMTAGGEWIYSSTHS
jgi:hypothetical protein